MATQKEGSIVEKPGITRQGPWIRDQEIFEMWQKCGRNVSLRGVAKGSQRCRGRYLRGRLWLYRMTITLKNCLFSLFVLSYIIKADTLPTPCRYLADPQNPHKHSFPIPPIPKWIFFKKKDLLNFFLKWVSQTELRQNSSLGVYTDYKF